MLQSFQTLQDPKTNVKVGEPYKRLPQLTLTANRPELPGGATFLLTMLVFFIGEARKRKRGRLA